MQQFEELKRRFAPLSGGGRPSRYKLADGTNVPGVTTITGRFKESGGLVHWAWQCGMDGKDYRKVRDDAADAGSLAHMMIDADIHGRDWDTVVPSDATDDTVERAETALHAFRIWRDQTKVEILVTELPIISERHRFGGTLDAVGRIGDTVVMLDWKSSNAIYSEYLAQVGAYVVLFEEKYELPIWEMHLLRVDKEFGSFHHHCWPRSVLVEAKIAFLRMRDLYDSMAILKRAAA